VSGFSDDGLWWWDGTRWIPTSGVVLPQLPPTEFELSGKLALARADLAKGRPGFWLHTLFLEGMFGLYPTNRRGLSEYRTWTLEQLALAAAYLLGPDEPMLAGEMSRHDVWDGWARNLAVAVTAAHVIVFRIDYLDGQPRWVGLAARPTAVTMKRSTRMIGFYQALEIRSQWGRWSILGFQGEKEFNPEPVLEAWRHAVRTTPQT
jgi:hypothetical protein